MAASSQASGLARDPAHNAWGHVSELFRQNMAPLFAFADDLAALREADLLVDGELYLDSLSDWPALQRYVTKRAYREAFVEQLKDRYYDYQEKFRLRAKRRARIVRHLKRRPPSTETEEDDFRKNLSIFDRMYGFCYMHRHELRGIILKDRRVDLRREPNYDVVVTSFLRYLRQHLGSYPFDLVRYESAQKDVAGDVLVIFLKCFFEDTPSHRAVPLPVSKRQSDGEDEVDARVAKILGDRERQRLSDATALNDTFVDPEIGRQRKAFKQIMDMLQIELSQRTRRTVFFEIIQPDGFECTLSVMVADDQQQMEEVLRIYCGEAWGDEVKPLSLSIFAELTHPSELVDAPPEFKSVDASEYEVVAKTYTEIFLDVLAEKIADGWIVQ
jgi:hypothetical protein